LDANLLEPAGLHDAGDTGRIVAVTLIDLHLEHRLGMARIDTDHRQAKPLELGPQPRARRSCLKTDPYRAWRFRPHKRSDRGRVGIPLTHTSAGCGQRNRILCVIHVRRLVRLAERPAADRVAACVSKIDYSKNAS